MVVKAATSASVRKVVLVTPDSSEQPPQLLNIHEEVVLVTPEQPRQPMNIHEDSRLRYSIVVKAATSASVRKVVLATPDSSEQPPQLLNIQKDSRYLLHSR